MSGESRQVQRVERQRFWRVHIRAWQKSGLSQNEYCHRNKLSKNQFWYWKRKMGREQAKAPTAFVPVLVPAGKKQSAVRDGDSGLTVLLDNGIRICLASEFAAATLVKAVSALGGKL